MRFAFILTALCFMMGALGADFVRTNVTVPIDSRTLNPSADSQPESTRKMIQRLDQIRRSMNPFEARFLSDQRAPLMAARLGLLTNTFEKADWRLKMAATLTEAGRPEAALEQFKILEDFMASATQPPAEEWKSAFLIRKAIAFLRLGEQENCLVNHNADSCLLPLR